MTASNVLMLKRIGTFPIAAIALRDGRPPLLGWIPGLPRILHVKFLVTILFILLMQVGLPWRYMHCRDNSGHVTFIIKVKKNTNSACMKKKLVLSIRVERCTGNQKTNQSQSFEPLIDMQTDQSIKQDFIQKCE